MKNTSIEHVNVTVENSVLTAETLCRVFDWKIRWQGEARDGGHTVHVGTEDVYLALYAPKDFKEGCGPSPQKRANLNHIGIMVDDLTAAEARVIEAGFKPHSHGDYEPGRRFYFDDNNGIEFEIVSYA